MPWNSADRARSAMILTPAEWKRVVTMNGCDVCGPGSDCEDVQSHHVITQQQLRKRGLEHLLWDHRNGLAVCERRHRRHTRAIERIRYGQLLIRNVVFAEEVGLDWILERYYPANPPDGGCG